MNALVLRLALGLALGVGVMGALAATHHEKPSGYAADGSIDLAGVYQPMNQPFIIGHFQLDGIRVETAAEFRNYESEKESRNLPSPVSILFSDLRTLRHSKDHDYYESEPIVRASRYRVDNATIALEGRHPQFGYVSFHGKLDTAALKATQADDRAYSEGTLLTGELRVGRKVYKDVEFYWFSGDV